MTSSQQPISGDSKARLIQLIEKTAQYAEEGGNPTAALIKAAEELDSPIEFIHRAAEAFNGGVHLTHLKQADADARGDSFPLADPEEAGRVVFADGGIDLIHPEKISEAIMFLPEGKSYFQREPEVFSPEEVKQAKAQKDAPQPIKYGEALKIAYSLDLREKLEIKKASDTHQEECVRLAKHVGHIRAEMKKTSAGQRKQWAQHVMEWRGKEAADILSVTLVIPHEELTKMAEVKSAVYFRSDIPEVVSLDNLVAESENAPQLHFKLAEAQMYHYMNNCERVSALDCASSEKRAIGYLPVLPFARGKEQLESTMTGPSPQESQQAALDQLVDPGVLQESGMIDQALLMQKLLNEDEIIGSGAYNPEDIEQSLGEINILAPDAAKYEPMLRTMLRRRLEMGRSLDDYELEKLFDLNKKVVERDTPQQLPPPQ